MGRNMNDLTNRTHGPLAEFAVSSYVYSGDGSQHVVFQGFDPAGHYFETQRTQHGFSMSNDYHVVEVWWTA
jgi:hypothetical protein